MSTVKRICFFGAVDACDPMKIGGCESLTRRLATGLSERDYSVAVVMYGAEKEEMKDDFFGKDVILQYHKTFLGALKGLNELKCEMVFEMYVHKRYYPLYLAYKYKNRGKKKFATILMTSPENAIKRWLRKIFRVMFCSNIFAVSPHLVEELKMDGIEAEWLPPPVPDFYFQTFEDKSNSAIIISYLGRIDANKGLGELEPIFKRLLDSNNVTIKVRGYYVPSDRGAVKLHDTFMGLKGVDYLAKLKNDCLYLPEKEKEIVKYLSGTDILVLPYKTLKGTVELPLLVLEGLAAGCVVLSKNVGDIRDVIGNTECIARDFEEFKEKLGKLCDPEKLRTVKGLLKSKNLFSTFAASEVVNRLINYL